MKESKTEVSGVYFKVILACLSLFSLGWMDNARGPFFPLFLEATQESATRGAFFFALASFVAILSSASAGIFIKKIGLKGLLFIGGSFMALSPFGLVIIPNLKGALLTALFFGLSLGWVAVGQNVLIGRIENDELRKRFFALLHSFYALAAMSAPLSVVYLKKIVSWNYLLLGVSVLLIPFLIMLFFFKTKESKDKVKELKAIQMPSLFSRKIFLWVLFMSFYIASELILSTRLVVLVQSFGRSFSEASNYLFFFFLSMFIVRIFFFFNKLNFSPLKVLLIGTSASFLFFILGYNVHPLFLALIGGSMGPVFPVVMNFISEQWPDAFDHLVGRIISVSSLFVVTAHILIGKVTDVYGVKLALNSVPVFLFCAIVLLLVVRKDQKNDNQSKK